MENFNRGRAIRADRRSERRLALVGLMVVFGLCAWGLSRSALGAEFVLIHNAKTGATSVTRAQLKEMAIGKKKTWPSGAPVQLVLAPVGSPEMRWFATEAAGIGDEVLMSKIKQEVFKGELRRPVFVSSDKDCVNAVAGDPGGVGVVSAEAAKSLPAGVTALPVQ